MSSDISGGIIKPSHSRQSVEDNHASGCATILSFCVDFVSVADRGSCSFGEAAPLLEADLRRLLRRGDRVGGLKV